MSLLLALAGGGGGSSVTGAIAWTEGSEASAIAASLSVTVANAWTEGGDTFALAGSLTVSLGNAWTEGGETVAIAGTVVTPVSATMAWTEGGETVAIAASVAVAYARLTRLPLDPMLPIVDDVQLMAARVNQVAGMIARLSNAAYLSLPVAASYKQLPQTMLPANTLYGLKISWNDRLNSILESFNILANAMNIEIMPHLTMMGSDNIKAFRVQFYDQYRQIAVKYNTLAKTIDTANGY